MPFHLANAGDHLTTALTSWCGGPSAFSITWLLFLTGLAGGLAHCGPMCGPFVLAQTADTPVLGRIASPLLLPYHLGRLTTYATLGVLSAGFGGALAGAGPPRWTVAILLLLTAALFASQAVSRFWPALLRRQGDRWGLRWASALAGLAARLLSQPSPTSRFGLGIVLGFLPCGFLYAALAAAAVTQEPAAGALAMAAFGLGTVPSLVLVGFGGSLTASRWRRLARHLLAPLFLFNASVLTVMALGAAFASP